jgi:hypothetical protein
METACSSKISVSTIRLSVAGTVGQTQTEVPRGLGLTPMSALKTTNKRLPIHPDKQDPPKCHHHHHRQTSLLEPSLEDFTKLHPVFTSLDFGTFFYGTRSSALRPTPNLEDQVTVFMSPSGRMAQICSLFVAM